MICNLRLSLSADSMEAVDGKAAGGQRNSREFLNQPKIWKSYKRKIIPIINVIPGRK